MRVARHAALFGGVRVMLGRAPTVGIGPLHVVDPDESPWPPDLDDVVATMGVEPFEVPAFRWHALIGVKLFVK